MRATTWSLFPLVSAVDLKLTVGHPRRDDRTSRQARRSFYLHGREMCARVFADLFDATAVEMTSTQDVAVAMEADDDKCPSRNCSTVTSSRDSEIAQEDGLEVPRSITEKSAPSETAKCRCRVVTSLTDVCQALSMTSSTCGSRQPQCHASNGHACNANDPPPEASACGTCNGSSSPLSPNGSSNRLRPRSADLRLLTDDCCVRRNFRPNSTFVNRKQSSWAEVTWVERQRAAASMLFQARPFSDCSPLPNDDTAEVSRTSVLTTFRPNEKHVSASESAADVTRSSDASSTCDVTQDKLAPIIATAQPVSLCRAYRMRRNHVTSGSRSTIQDVDAILRRLRSTMTSTRIAKQSARRDGDSRRRTVNDNDNQSTTTTSSPEISKCHVNSCQPEAQVLPSTSASVSAVGDGDTPVSDCCSCNSVRQSSSTSTCRCNTLKNQESQRVGSDNLSTGTSPDKVNSGIFQEAFSNGSTDAVTAGAIASRDVAFVFPSFSASLEGIGGILKPLPLPPQSFIDADSLESSITSSAAAAAVADSSSSSTSNGDVTSNIFPTAAVIGWEVRPETDDVTCSTQSRRRIDSGLDTLPMTRGVELTSAGVGVPDNVTRRRHVGCLSDDTGSVVSQQGSTGIEPVVDSLTVSLTESATSASSSSSSSSSSLSSSSFNCPSSMADSWNYNCYEQRPPYGDSCQNVDENQRSQLTKQKRKSFLKLNTAVNELTKDLRGDLWRHKSPLTVTRLCQALQSRPRSFLTTAGAVIYRSRKAKGSRVCEYVDRPRFEPVSWYLQISKPATIPFECT